MMDSHRDEIAKLESLYASNPEGRVFTHLAEACRKAGQLDRAREILEDGLRRHPDYASAHVVLGRVLSDNGDRSSAAHAFRRVLELDRHNLVALRSLGDLARAGDRTDEALYYYGELAVLDPTDGGIQEEIRRLRAQIAVAAPAAPESTAPAQPASEPASTEVTEVRVETPAAPATLEPEAFFASSAAAAASPADERPTGWSIDETAGPESVPSPGSERMEGLEASAVSQEESASEPADAGREEPEAAVAPDAAKTTTPAAESEEARPDSTWDLGATALPRTDSAAEAERRAELGDSGEWIPAERWEWMAASADPDAVQESSEGVAAEAEPEPAPAAELAEESGWDAEPAGDEEEYEPEPVELEGIDAEVITAFSATYEVSEFTVESVPPLLEAEEEAVGDYGMSDDDEGDQVITETLAEIYATQGLYERAAAVYRRLLRQRPGDERLAARLRDLEKSPTWSGSTETSEPESAGLTLAEPGSGESWLERVESAWTGGEGAVSAEESPYAWPSERTDDEPAGRRVGDYFRSLLSWRPGASESPGVAAGPAEPVGGTLDADPATSFDQWFGGRDASERAGAPEPGRDAAGEGDEDLEMFRSWLKSLKK